MGLIGKLFCGLIIVLGASEIIGQAPTALKGVQLARSGEPTIVQIVDKAIERPGPRSRPRVESVSVNGERVRSVRTYFNQYVLTVRYEGTDGAITAKAPVSYDRWHALGVGENVAADVSADAPDFADADGSGTLFYALRQMLFGLLVMAVGLIALRLPDSES